jgi:hypothetical protein
MVSVESAEPRLTVVVPCRSITQQLEDLLETLLAASCEIVVVQAQHESDLPMEPCGPSGYTDQGVCWLFAAAFTRKPDSYWYCTYSCRPDLGIACG